MRAAPARTAAQWLERAEAFLRERGVPEPEASAQFLLAEALGVGRGEALAGGSRAVSERQAYRFWDWIRRRARREPLAYILGRQPFLGLDLEVTPDVLIPRPETEELVMECERLLKAAGPERPRVLDLGTGSGCIAVALAQLLPQSLVIATDISDKALRLAAKNAAAHGVASRVRFVREDLFSDKPGPRAWADLLVSNPPYIPTAELEGLSPEVLGEPRLALDGGADGLDAVRAVAAAAPRLLKPGGFLVLEIGAGQFSETARILRRAGLSEPACRRDAAGVERIAAAKMVA